MPASDNTKPSIWLVSSGRAELRGGCDAVESKLKSSGCEIVRIHDVYRALARLGSENTRLPSALMVCLNDVGPAELEFFAIMARSHRDIAVYVYGDQRSRSRVNRAIALGATGEATQTIVEALLGAAKPEAGASQTGNANVRQVAPAALVQSGQPILTIQDGTEDDHADEEDAQEIDRGDNGSNRLSIRTSSNIPAAHEEWDKGAANEESPIGPARVPWLRYNDVALPVTNRRIPPTRVVESEASERVDKSSSRIPPPLTNGFRQSPHATSSTPFETKNNGYEPLLSEAELEALMGDESAGSSMEQSPIPERTEEETY